MTKRSARSSVGFPHAALFFAVLTLVMFAGGESLILMRTDSGQLTAARYLGVGSRARVTQLIGRQIRRGLDAASIPRDSVSERIVEGATPSVRWRVGLTPDAAPLQVNYAVTRCVEDQGGAVLSGVERVGKSGEEIVSLVIGLNGRATHQVDLVRAPHPLGLTPEIVPRLALLLFGFEDDTKAASAFFRLPFPFAALLGPGAESGDSLFNAAHAQQREVVLHLPLEPINYPQVSPGPGTILVTMGASKISGIVRHDIERADPVIAVANNLGSLATQDTPVMKTVYEELKRRQLPFLHIAPVPGAVCKDLAADQGVAYQEPYAVIDGETKYEKTKPLDKRWNLVLAAARDRRGTIVLLRATPLTLKWLPGALTSKRLGGVSLVPLSALLERPSGP